MAREGNRPDRRIVPAGDIAPEELKALLERVRYGGSALHKLRPGDYGFVPPNNPRPSKTPCDEIRPVLKDEASSLFRLGIELGMVSRFQPGEVPKYVWAVDGDGEVYEAKTRATHEVEYHGYRLGEDEKQMRSIVIREWDRRCQSK